MIDLSEAEIVNNFRNGSREAFTKLVERYQNLVTSVALAKTGDIQKSEDIAQQTFLIAWEKQSELADNTRFGGWVRNIAINLSKNENRLHYSINQKSSTPIEPQNEPEGNATAPDKNLSAREQQELLWSTLDAIPIEYAEPMILFYREDQSIAAVAEQLNLSEDAVKQRLRRGRAMLKEEIESFVEETLYETRPSAVFLAGVMAAIPSVSSVTKATLSTTISAGIKSMFSTIGLGSFFGFLFGGLGALAGVGGAWIGSNYAAKQATSDEEKSLIWWFFKLVIVETLAFVGLLLVTISFVPSNTTLFGILLTGLILAHVGLILGQIAFYNKRTRQLHEQHGKPEYLQKFEANQEIQPVSTIGLRANAIGMLGGSWMWIPMYSATRANYSIMSCSILCIVGLCLLAWVWAPTHRLPSQQLRYNGRLVKLSVILQTLFLIVTWSVLRFFAPAELATFGEQTLSVGLLIMIGMIGMSFWIGHWTERKAVELEKKE